MDSCHAANLKLLFERLGGLLKKMFNAGQCEFVIFLKKAHLHLVYRQQQIAHHIINDILYCFFHYVLTLKMNSPISVILEEPFLKH